LLSDFLELLGIALFFELSFFGGFFLLQFLLGLLFLALGMLDLLALDDFADFVLVAAVGFLLQFGFALFAFELSLLLGC